MPYCSRCDREDVTHLHRCFLVVGNTKPVRPLAKKPNQKNKVSVRLLERLRNHPQIGYIEEEGRLERLYPGWCQRANGAWLWSLEGVAGDGLGSTFTMTECLNADRLLVCTCDSGTEVFPENDKVNK